MGFVSLHKAVMLLVHPVLWLPGLFLGLVSSCVFYLSFSGNAGIFYSERLFVFSLVLLPFFMAGAYGSVRTKDYSVKNFTREGIFGYFRILLPTVLISSAALILLLFIAMPTAMTGMSGAMLFGGAFFLLIIPFILLAFFYDTAAVFEGKKVFDSIKRSFEVSFLCSGKILGFYAVALLIILVMFTGFSMIWSVILTEQFEPLMDMTTEELNSFASDPDALIMMLGEYGIFITSVLTFLGVFVFTVIFLPYKAVFYQDFLMNAKISPVFVEPEGEYDEKGRWYKYS